MGKVSKRWEESLIDRKSMQSSYTYPTAQRLWHGNSYRLVSGLGNSSSFVSQILNSTMLVTSTMVVHCEISRLLCCLTTPVNHDTIRSSIAIRELTQRVAL